MQTATFIVVVIMAILLGITMTRLKELKDNYQELLSIISRIYNLIKP